MKSEVNLIFDFDSTLVRLETLDELAKVVLTGAPDARERVRKIAKITERGMNGEIGFQQSLAERLAIIMPSKAHMTQMHQMLSVAISPSILKYRRQIQAQADKVWIISGGFKELIVPIAQQFGVAPDHVFANDFIWNDGERAIGYEKDNLLAQDNGKITVVRSLNLPPENTYIIGDGSTDYAIRAAGLAGTFIAYTETVARPTVIEKADYVAKNFDDVAKILAWQS